MSTLPLYTNLVRYKQAVNGGRLPPMMALPEAALGVIDPDFTIGLGAIYEDEDRGLRCPVRGCGQFHHHLTRHVRVAHADIGGVAEIKHLLSIAKSVALISARQRAAYRDVASRSGFKKGHSDRPRRTPKAVQMTAESNSRAKGSVGWRNLRNECEAQTAQKILDLQVKIGRSPSIADAVAEYGSGFPQRVAGIWGTWNSAKSQLGLRTKRATTYSTDEVLDALQAWYAAHNELPLQREALVGDRLPFIPSPHSILKTFKTGSWTKAMQIVASLLDIRGGRYGLPEKKVTAA